MMNRMAGHLLQHSTGTFYKVFGVTVRVEAHHVAAKETLAYGLAEWQDGEKVLAGKWRVQEESNAKLLLLRHPLS